MVQTTNLPDRIYEHPLEVVVKAYNMRYPKCDKMPFLLDSEVLFDREEKGVRVTQRRCYVKLDVPYVIKRFVGVDRFAFKQTYYFDKAKRTFLIEAVNESFLERVKIAEKCLYSVHPENPNWTLLTQEATLEIISVFGLEALVERAVLRQYRLNHDKTTNLIDDFIAEMEITPPTTPPSQPAPVPSRRNRLRRHFQRKAAKQHFESEKVEASQEPNQQPTQQLDPTLEPNKPHAQRFTQQQQQQRQQQPQKNEEHKSPLSRFKRKDSHSKTDQQDSTNNTLYLNDNSRDPDNNSRLKYVHYSNTTPPDRAHNLSSPSTNLSASLSKTTIDSDQKNGLKNKKNTNKNSLKSFRSLYNIEYSDI